MSAGASCGQRLTPPPARGTPGIVVGWRRSAGCPRGSGLRVPASPAPGSSAEGRGESPPASPPTPLTLSGCWWPVWAAVSVTMSGSGARGAAAEREEFVSFFPQIVRDLTEDGLGHPEVGDAVARLKEVREAPGAGGR